MKIKGIACDNETEFEQEITQIIFFEVNTKYYHGVSAECLMPNGKSFSIDTDRIIVITD